VTRDFYDELAPWYHLVFEDWDRSMARQGMQLDAIIRAKWGGRLHSVLDAAAGIGTQSIALAALGYDVTASDISTGAIARLTREAAQRGLTIHTGVEDLRTLSRSCAARDLVIACDNSLPHLLSDEEILQALRECFSCTRPGGGILISMRDYEVPPAGGTETRPYGTRKQGDASFVLTQVWEWDPPYYDLAFTITEETTDPACRPKVFRTRYYAVSVARVMELMTESGYTRVRRVDGAFYQPVIVGTRA
jgi:SAM-dependent methyltransferase